VELAAVLDRRPPRIPFIPAMVFLVTGLAPAYEMRGESVMLEPRLSVGDDFQVGARAGYALRTLEARAFSVFLDGEARPLSEGIRVRSSPTLSYQYQETRWSLGPGISAGYPLTESWMATLSLGAAYSDGNYQGSNREPQSGWNGWGDAGLRYNLESFGYWAVSLQYRPLPGIVPVRVLVQYGLEIGKGFVR
jgi:hypothetical protein